MTSFSTDRLITFQSLMILKSVSRGLEVFYQLSWWAHSYHSNNTPPLGPHVLLPCPTSLKSTIRSEQTTKSSGVGGGEDRKQSNKSPLRCQLWTVFKATGPLLLLHQNSVNVVGSWGKYDALTGQYFHAQKLDLSSPECTLGSDNDNKSNTFNTAVIHIVVALGLEHTSDRNEVIITCPCHLSQTNW